MQLNNPKEFEKDLHYLKTEVNNLPWIITLLFEQLTSKKFDEAMSTAKKMDKELSFFQAQVEQFIEKHQ
jgi:hypothetical protein